MRRLPCLPLTGPATARLIRGLSTHSDSLSQANRATQNTLSPDTVLTCHSGRRYLIERVLQKKENSPLGVYLAKSGIEKFVLEDVPDLAYLRDIYSKVSNCPHLRLPQDTIPGRSMYIHKYFSDDFLSLVAKADLPLETTKRILKGALQGIAALHDQKIVHNANNILVDGKSADIASVQLADIEDAAIVPPGSAIMDRQLDNWMWRSPKAHAESPMHTPSDIFAFGIVCIYAVHKRIIFAVDESDLGEGEEILADVLERQFSYFADAEGIQGFLEYIHRSPYAEVFRVIRDGFDQQNPRRPFALWEGVEPVFKDLACKMTAFGPRKIITAREALAHLWFEGI